MSAFEFVLTLYAIVIALGVARVLTGYVALIEFRRAVVDVPLFFIWLSFLLLVHFVWWFSLWNNSAAQSFSLIAAIFQFHVPAFLFIASRLLVPSESELETIAERFAKLRVPFLVSLARPFVTPLLGAIVTGDWSIVMYLLPIGAVLLLGTASSNIRLQYSVAMAAFLIYVVFAVQFRSAVSG